MPRLIPLRCRRVYDLPGGAVVKDCLTTPTVKQSLTVGRRASFLNLR